MYKNNIHQVFEKLNEFIKKYHLNQMIKGVINTTSFVVILFLFFAIVEHLLSLDVNGRTLLFWTYILTSFFVFSKLIVLPALSWFKLGKSLDYKDAAKIIGDHFPEIKDKLVNLLELSEISSSQNALITASIDQKISELSPISFKNAIDFSLNKRYLKWIFLPAIIITSFIISGKYYILSESSARIIKHNTFFEPKAPFKYVILNKKLACKQFDDFLLHIKVEGREIPSDVFIQLGDNMFKLNNLNNNEFSYAFSRVHKDLSFQLSAGGYKSNPYTIKSLIQPKIVNTKILISHPKHTNKKPMLIENNGDFTISEGGIADWNIILEHTNNCRFIIDNNVVQESSKKEVQLSKKIFRNTSYSIVVSNNNNLTDTLNYSIKVVLDQFPKISLTQSYDTVNTRHLFSGIIEDDYLVTKLELIYTYTKNDSIIKSSEEIRVQRKSLQQFFHTVNFEKLTLEAGTKLNYYFKVWDNDGVNGPKFTKSKVFTYKKATKNEMIAKKDLDDAKTKEGLNTSISMTKELQKNITELKKKMLQKKKIGWEEKQKIKAIIKKQKDLEKKITETQKKNSESLKTKEKLNPAIIEKQKKLEELMNKVLDKELKNLIDEIDKIMNNAEKEKLKELLEKLNNENKNLEKELDRELELFKQLEFQQKLEEAIDKINSLKQRQKGLKNKTEKQNSHKKHNLAMEQESISEEMKELKKDLQKIREKNMQLEEPNEMPKTQKLEDDIEKNMQESQGALQKNRKNKSSKAQENAINKIMQLENKLQKMMQTSSENKQVEDMESLRKILENLITLSFDQESLMNNTNSTPRNSPDFVRIVRDQNKLFDNSQIIEDSLFALSKRVVEIQATINKEIASISSNMKKATKKLEERDINSAVGKQQFIMTSTNNLALLLSEILEQMQKELDMPSSQCNKPKNCNKPNPNCKKPSISELKKAQQQLNEKIGKEGKKKNKKGCEQGEGRSKDLMMLAKQQEEIRKRLRELRDEIGKNGEKGKIDKMLKDMEENERDIINDRITEETIKRQEDILSRMLESEDSKREQDEDEKRQSNEWNFEINEDTTKDFIKYEQIKKAQEELMKTTPIQLTPFYKKKVNNYFNQIIND